VFWDVELKRNIRQKMNFVKTLKEKINTRVNLKAIIINIGWQSFDKLFRMGTGIIVSVWVTRFLGPEQFGVLSYAMAFSGIFACLASLGIDGIIIRELSKNPTKKDNLLGTSFLLKLFGAIVAFILTIVAIILVKPFDYSTIIFVGIIALGMFFNAFDVIDLWFQSQIKYKFTVFAKNYAFMVSAILKILLILNKASLIYFVIIATVEVILGAIGLIIVFVVTKNKIRNWTASLGLSKIILLESWPLIIAGFATFIYLRIGQIMLGSMLDNKAVGTYSAAIKFSEIWYFIPGAIYASVLPRLAQIKLENEELFYLKYQKICSIMALISITIAIIMTFISIHLVNIVYGIRYIESGPILAVHIWAGVFVFIGVAGSIWTMIEGFQKFQLFATVSGGVANILLNVILVPKYGGLGAALATVISYSIAGYLFYFVQPSTRKIAIILTKAIFTPWDSFKK
jgi:polysaccharide transporter, PST family